MGEPEENGRLGECLACGGVRVQVFTGKANAPSGKTQPPWVTAGLELAEKRIREYQAETGRWPGQGMLDRFQKTMAERVKQFREDPVKHPWHPCGLRVFEGEEPRER